MLSHLFKKPCPPAAAAPPLRGKGVGLSIAAIEDLAAHGHLKAACPQVWERICLFCDDPAHLDSYLTSLSIQGRGGKRTGFPPEVMSEIAAIQAANQRLLPVSTADTSWNTTSVYR